MFPGGMVNEQSEAVLVVCHWHLKWMMRVLNRLIYSFERGSDIATYLASWDFRSFDECRTLETDA